MRLAILRGMQGTGRRWGWLAFAAVAAAVVAYLTFAGSAGISCGAYDGGPSPGAEERFCGYGPGDAARFGMRFYLVQLIPALPVLGGGAATFRGRPAWPIAAGIAAAIPTIALVWFFEP